MLKKLIPGIFFISILIPVIISGGCDHRSVSWHKKEGLIWNTSYHFSYNGPAELADSAIALLARVGQSLSVFDSTSLVSRVNCCDSTPVNTDFIRVYIMSKQVNKISDGAFDPTLSPLITAWGFGKGHQATADTIAIDSILQFVGINKTRLSHDALIKDDNRIEFNFSAIAKGYGCDVVAEMLIKNNVEDFLIEIGGEIRAGGKNPEGGDWRISIDRPILSKDKELHESQVIISTSDVGLATSGNYRNFHNSKSGSVYGHVISPATGRPVTTDVISATVIAPSAMEADALATAFMAIGSEKVKDLSKSLRCPVMLG
ncbi:MAG: FAD:protein FMN transferase, partial [Muribaculaceae bacterium]|nr:FAD:protein FMN transferase [Muribaculaceae bacterium]